MFFTDIKTTENVIMLDSDTCIYMLLQSVSITVIIVQVAIFQGVWCVSMD